MKSKEIQREIDTISPLVAENLKILTPDPVPDGYFDELESLIMGQMTIEDLRKVGITEVPEDVQYFDTLTDRIMLNISQSVGKRETIIRRISQSFIFKVAAVAFVFMSIAGITYYYNNLDKNQYDALYDEAYIEYLKSNIDDVDVSMLIKSKMIDESMLNDIPSYPIYKEMYNVNEDE